jgi:RNA polymerase sigma-70 factor (ECF subfamily)
MGQVATSRSLPAQVERVDRQLLDGALSREPEKWQRFYRRYQPFITACVAHVLKCRQIPFGREDLEDFVADVWVALLRNDKEVLRRFDPRRGRTLSSWLRLIATRSTIDRLRGRAIQQRYREIGAELDEPLDESNGPDARLEAMERATLARQAIAQLKPRDQQFLNLCLEDVDPNEVAQRLGIAVSTVHSRRFKIGQKIIRMIRREQRVARAPAGLRVLSTVAASPAWC